jgi:hypothetical protein
VALAFLALAAAVLSFLRNRTGLYSHDGDG